MTALTLAGLTLLCVNPALTWGEGHVNLLLSGVMCLSPLVLLWRGGRIFIPRIDIPLLTVCLCVTAGPLVFHPDTVRWSTMLFTCAYCMFFMTLARLLRGACALSPDLLCRMIRIIVYAFALILIIQQLCLLTGIPVPLRNPDYDSVAPWKLNSLMTEPSHTTVVLSTLMYFYTWTRRTMSPDESLQTDIRRWPWLWAAFSWTCLSTMNASALVLCPLCLLPYMTDRNSLIIGGGIAALALLAVYFTPAGDLPQVNRLRDFSLAIITGDDKSIENADLSAAARILPTLRGARLIDPADIRTYTGHGVDADIRDTAPREPWKNDRGFAGIFSMWHNYGAICAMAFWAALAMVTVTRRHWLGYVTFMFALQMSADYNMQLVWMIMAWSMTFKYCVCGHRRMLAPFKSDKI